jgi:hypothetical protein
LVGWASVKWPSASCCVGWAAASGRGHRADSPEPIVVTPALAVGRWLAGGPAPGTGGLFQTGIARWLDESDKW